jgi:hypothetical protein
MSYPISERDQQADYKPQKQKTDIVEWRIVREGIIEDNNEHNCDQCLENSISPQHFFVRFLLQVAILFSHFFPISWSSFTPITVHVYINMTIRV